MDILTETQNLWQRFRSGTAFRLYLRERLHLVVPAMIIFVAFSVTTTAGMVITLGGTHSFLVLLAMVLAPFVLVGSLYVQVFVFFSWLENRAIAQAAHRARKDARQELAATYASLLAVVGGFPPLVQAIGAALVLLPLALFALLSTKVAVLMLVLVAATPAAYALLDR